MRITAFALIGLGVVLTLANWATLIGSSRAKRHISSAFPAPSVFTLVGLALLPTTRPYAWIALFTDHTLFALAVALPKMLAQEWRTSRFTRVHLLEASDPPRSFRLSLHRGGHFRLRARCAPPVPANHHGALVASFGAVGRWTTEQADFLLTDYQEDRILRLRRNDASSYVGDDESFPVDAEFPYDSIQGVVFRKAT